MKLNQYVVVDNHANGAPLPIHGPFPSKGFAVDFVESKLQAIKLEIMSTESPSSFESFGSVDEGNLSIGLRSVKNGRSGPSSTRIAWYSIFPLLSGEGE